MKSGCQRLAALDELRGLCILLVVVYHGAFDLVNYYHINLPLFSSPFMNFLQPFFAGIFVALAGVTCYFSRNNLRRGGLALLCAAALTLVTLIVTPDMAIWFGILHLLGVCMLSFPLVRPVLDKLSPGLCLGIFLALFAVTWLVPSGWLGFLGFHLLPLSSQLYTQPYLAFAGFPTPDFVSGDYFPLIPWGFLFLAGTGLGKHFVQQGAPGWLAPSRLPFLAACGRRSLLIYLAHQPLLMLLFSLLEKL